ncbi:MAG: DUF167 domain-containing protein [bacterium]
MVKLEVEVTPRAARAGVVGRRGDVLKVRVAAPPEGGRANKELIRLVANFLGVPRASVTVARGAAARRKLLDIEGLAVGDLAAALARASPLDG